VTRLGWTCRNDGVPAEALNSTAGCASRIGKRTCLPALASRFRHSPWRRRLLAWRS